MCLLAISASAVSILLRIFLPISDGLGVNFRMYIFTSSLLGNSLAVESLKSLWEIWLLICTKFISKTMQTVFRISITGWSLDCKEIQPVHPKGNQFWIFIGRTDAEAETPMLWPPDVKNWLTGKHPNAWRKRKGMTEDEMVGWRHWLEGHESEQAPGVGSPGGCKEFDMTERLNWTEKCYISECSLWYHSTEWKEEMSWRKQNEVKNRGRT